MFYIFLDIDGVLNTESDWRRPFTLNKKCVGAFLGYIQELRKNKKDEVSIILTSSWKTGFNKNGSHAAHITDLLRAFSEINLRISDKTEDYEGMDRGVSVEMYLKKHGIAADKYIVIDDDKALFPYSPDLNLYLTNAAVGFTEKDKPGIKKGGIVSWLERFF